ncbi:MAG: DUF962 domain-containing protein [Terriglobales bacterium]
MSAFRAESLAQSRPGRIIETIADEKARGFARRTDERVRPLRGSDRAIILGVLGGRTHEQWIAQYGFSHRHPVNRFCHTLGIPTILLSIPLFIASIFFHRLWLYGLALFLIGWIFQFIGHAFEGKPPEFFHDWRFLFVGVRWWWAKIHGKA